MGSLKSGYTKSCGCLKRELTKLVEGVPSKEHKLYPVWNNMKQRCRDELHPAYSNYGGRGIKVCQRWQDSFEDFVSDMGPRPEGHTLDRIDNGGNYTPDNCRWASNAEQSRNTCRNHFITHKGETLCLKDWSLKLGGCATLVHVRIKNYGWSEERAVSTPIRS